MLGKKLVGQTIDHYNIIRHIDRGGMADVYLAEDINLGRNVAFKVLLGGLSHDPQFIERFRREARTIAKLHHQNIVQIYGIGKTDLELPYIAMQYIDGGSLRDKLRDLASRGKLLTTEQALNTIRQLAQALATAHDAGIVHRDLKPSNVLVRSDGTPVIVDLGIAAVENSARLTQTGGLLGTPHYMSPEQASGQKVDGRSDIYSLGIILYELLGGRTPYQADSAMGIIHQHLHVPVPPLENLRHGLSPNTLSVVDRCLQKNPQYRYKEADELVAAIDDALRAEGKSGPNPTSTQVLTQLHDSVLLSREQYVHDSEAQTTPFHQPTPHATPIAPPHGRTYPPPPPAAVPAPAPAPAPAKNSVRQFLTGFVIVLGLLLLGGGLAGGGWYIWQQGNEQATATPRAAAVAADEEATETPLPPTNVPSTSTPAVTVIIATPTQNPAQPETAAPKDTPVSIATPLPTATATPVLPELFVSENDGMEMRLIPAGPFLMGSTITEVEQALELCRSRPDGDSCSYSEFSGELPQHTVYLDAYYMDRLEVTQTQYRICVNVGACDPPDDGRFYNNSDYNNHPIVFVSWFDARDYCAWAGKRLPTEAEWEKAARGDDGRLFPWGNSFANNRANTQDDGTEEFGPVGQFPGGASPYGILDMAGSVWEYVYDWYDPDYYRLAPTENPQGPNSSPDGLRVLRSGSFANYQVYARVANRGTIEPGTSTQFRGIRCVLSANNAAP